MTTLYSLDFTCAVCGKTAKFDCISSTSVFGHMDLDTRPAEVKRSTLAYDVQECPYCHYCNHEISDLIPGVTKELLVTYPVQSIINSSDLPQVVRKFLVAGTLNELTGNLKEAGYLFLNAAWLFDDLDDYVNAAKCRKKSIEHLENYLKNNSDTNYRCLLVDLYRRAELFDQAKTEAEMLLKEVYGDGLLGKILKFQLELINRKDAKCHNLGEIPNL